MAKGLFEEKPVEFLDAFQHMFNRFNHYCAVETYFFDCFCYVFPVDVSITDSEVGVAFTVVVTDMYVYQTIRETFDKDFDLAV